MAINEEQKKIIRHEISLGTSGRETAKKAGCGEKAVRGLIKREGLEKDALQTLAKDEVTNIIIEDELRTQKKNVKRRKIDLTDAQKDAYEDILTDTKTTHAVASNYQSQLLTRQSFDATTIDAIIVMKGKELKEADTPEEVLRINLKYREYISIIVDNKDVKDGVEANDKAMITKGEAPRFAPKSDTTVNNLTLVDSDKSFKGKF